MSKELVSTIKKIPFPLPVGWTWYRWGDLITSYQQGLIRSNSELGDGNVDYLKMGDIDNYGWHSSRNLATTTASTDEIETYKLKKGDFLINVRNSMELVGKTCLIRYLPNTTLYNHMLVRITHHSSVPNEYVNAIFTTSLMNKFLSKFKSGTTTVIALYKDDLIEIPIPIPPQKTLNGIVNIIESIDRKIELNNKIISELEQMAKELYDYWFLQFEFPDANGKTYRSSGGKMVYNPTLKREIPEGWKTKTIEGSTDCLFGFPFNTEYFNEINIGVPVMRIRDILDNSISCYSTENADEKYRLNNNDVVIGMDGNFHINLWSNGDAYINQRCARIRCNSNENTSSLFIIYQITPHIKQRELTVSRTTVGHLSNDDIRKINIVLPKDRKLVEGFDIYAKKIISFKEQNRELATLRDWLLPMLMNGQVTVQAETKEETKKETPIINLSQQRNQRFELWLSNRGAAARGEIDKATLREIFDAMDEDDK